MTQILDGVDQRTKLVGRNRMELLLFFLGGKQRYGINVFKVQEVVRCPHLTHIPQSHPSVRGVATMRGGTISIIDLNMAMAGSPIDDPSTGNVIVTEYSRSIQGFLVSGVDRIVNIKWEDIAPPPKGAGKGSYLTAVTRIDEELVEIIDVERVLAETGDFIDRERVSEELRSEYKRHHGHHHLVLAADDSSVARQQIQNTLDDIGVEGVICKNGREALDTLRRWADEDNDMFKRLIMVVSDIEMPEMDGYTLTSEIRNDSQLKGLYILLHTSLSGVFNGSLVSKVGADAFVAKFSANELAEKIEEQLKAVDQDVAIA